MGAKEDHENLMDVATRAFGDAVDEVQNFVSSGMEALGYKQRIEWDDPDPNPDTGGGQQRRGPSFTTRQQQQQQQPPRQRQVGGGGNGGGRGEYGG